MSESRPLHEAEIRRNEAEAKKHAAEARKFTAEAKQAEIVLREKELRERNELAKDVHHHVYVFDGSVSDSTVKSCINQLVIWHRQAPDCEIEIQVNSPGGSIVDGFALIDFIRGLRKHGHKITMVALGYAASMAGVILQAADERVMGKHAFMLLHEGSLGATGDFAKVEDRVEFMKTKLHPKILDLFAERSTLTAKQIQNRWERKDWWLTAEEALKFGFVDSVR